MVAFPFGFPLNQPTRESQAKLAVGPQGKLGSGFCQSRYAFQFVLKGHQKYFFFFNLVLVAGGGLQKGD